MESSAATAIREHLVAFIDGQITIGDFDAWFVPATWDIEEADDPRAYELTNEIFLVLAEYGRGHRTEAELKSILRPLTQIPVGVR